MFVILAVTDRTDAIARNCAFPALLETVDVQGSKLLKRKIPCFALLANVDRSIGCSWPLGGGTLLV